MPPKENETDEEYQERLYESEILAEENYKKYKKRYKKEEYYKNKKLYGKSDRRF